MPPYRFITPIILLFWSISSLALPCRKTRAVFDIGSGSTKMMVAQVDICKRKVIKSLARTKTSLGYMDALQKSPHGIFPPSIIARGLQTLKSLKKRAKTLGAKEFFGTATAAFRSAKNAQDVLEQFGQQTGISLQIISSCTEAMLGYQGVSSTLGTAQISVWDIGGGSMQIVHRSPHNTEALLIAKGAVNFKNDVLRELRYPNHVTSPNPIGYKNVPALLQLSHAIALSSLKKKITLYPKVYGIGGVHNLSIAKQVGKSSFNQADLHQQLLRKSKFKDENIDSKFPETEITNLALVLGFMQYLNIAMVQVLNINLTDGLITLESSKDLDSFSKVSCLKKEINPY